MGAATTDPADISVTELSTAECAELLATTDLGRVAVLTDGHPEIFPVNHVYDTQLGRVVFPTGDGSKLHAAACSWPWAAFEIDGTDTDSLGGWSVMVVGEVVELEYADDVARAESRRTALWYDGGAARWLSIDPSRISGRRITVAPGNDVIVLP